MILYKASVTIVPKDGVLDTQGKAVEKTLKGNGYGDVHDVRVGRFVMLSLAAEDPAAARRRVEAVCDDLLVNELIETCHIALEAVS